MLTHSQTVAVAHADAWTYAAGLASYTQLLTALDALHLAVTMRPLGHGGLSPAERSAVDRARATLRSAAGG